MAELRGNVRDRRAFGEQGTRKGMAQVVQAMSAYAGAFHSASEALADARFVQRIAGAVVEDEIDLGFIRIFAWSGLGFRRSPDGQSDGRQNNC